MSSEELRQELHDIDSNLYARAIMNVMKRSSEDDTLRKEVSGSFNTEFPNLLVAVEMVRIQAERTGVDMVGATNMQRGAMIALQGLKEMIELERLERIEEL